MIENIYKSYLKRKPHAGYIKNFLQQLKDNSIKKWAKNPSFLQRCNTNGQHALKRRSVISNQRHAHQSMNEQTDTHTHTHTEYYSVFKRKEF